MSLKFSEELQKKYETELATKIEELKKELRDDKLWVKAKEKKKLGLYCKRRKYEKDYRMYVGEVTVKGVSPSDYYHKFEKTGDEKDLKSRNKRLKFYRTIEKYNDNQYLIQNCGKTGIFLVVSDYLGVKGIKDREFLGMTLVKEDENSLFELCSSVSEEDDKLVPLDDVKKNKRATILCGYYIEKKDDGCFIQFFNFVNPRGKIGSGLMNASVLDACMDVIKRAKKKYG